MLEQQDKYRDYLRHRAVQNIRANVRQFRIIITLPIDIALFVMVEWVIATFHISPFWRLDGNGQSDLGSFVGLRVVFDIGYTYRFGNVQHRLGNTCPT